MLDKELYFKIKWLIARNELASKRRRGGFEYQKPKDERIISIHQRASGVHLGLRAVQTKNILNWMDSIDINLNDINQYEFDFDNSLIPDIGINLNEFKCYPLSTTVHTALEFINRHKNRRPIIFENDFWYFQEIIGTHITNLDSIAKNDVLIISVPFFEDFRVKQNMDDILARCCELDVPVMLDLVWLPLIENITALKNTDCVEVFTQSMTKVLPMSGIKGGFCFWRQPVLERNNLYPLGNNVGFYITKRYLAEFGYYHVRDSLRASQKEWCEILKLDYHSLVVAAGIPDGHFLYDQSLHSHRIPNTKIFNLVPYYENNTSIKKLLSDNNRVDKNDN